MITRKLVFLGLIGFYSCMPMYSKAEYSEEFKDLMRQIQHKQLLLQNAELDRQINPTFFDGAKDFWDRHQGTIINMGLLVGAICIATYLQMKMLQGSEKQFGFYKKGEIKTTFNDVIGAQEAKDSLQDVIAYLKNPKEYEKLGIKMPAGVLLVGAPGNGKTLLARAVAGEAGVNFISASGSQFIEMFVGVGAARVRQLFDLARQNGPCIIFIDEIDAIGRKRGSSLFNSENIQTLNELLNQLDGFNTKKYPIILMAATNDADVLDEALIRPGRFDRVINVSLPNASERKQILELYLKNKTHMLTQEDILRVAQVAIGFSGAELENLVNQAALLAAKNKTELSSVDFDKAVDILTLGAERKMTVSSQLLERVAYHEIGHTLVAVYNEPVLGSTFHKVTIIPRGGALGLTYSVPSEENMVLMTQEQLLANIRVLLGGYVAEELMCGQTSTGVSSDLQRASNIARRMVSMYGMNKDAGKVCYQLQSNGSGRVYSEDTLKKIDIAAQQIVEEQYQWVKAFLQAHKASLKLVGDTLLKEETLTDKQVKELLGDTFCPVMAAIA